MTARIPYDELGLFHENCAEYDIAYDGAPDVRRIRVEIEPGLHLSALKWGRGEPEMVFLHGGAQNAHTWDTVLLKLRRPALAIDLPGHGHSDWWPDHLYWPEPNAAKVAKVIEREAPNAHLVTGMSLGGLTLIALAAARPDLVRQALIVDVTPGVNQEKGKIVADFVNGPQSFPDFQSLLDRTIEHNPTRTVASLRRGILHNARQLDDGTWQWRYDRTFSGAGGDQGHPDWSPLWDAVSSLTMPITLARGVFSPVVVDEDVEEFVRRQPSTRVEIFERSGHSIQGDEPIELAALIADLLA